MATKTHEHHKEVTLPVAGMTCAACVNRVEKALRGLPGVQECSVNLSAGKAGVVYDPAACDVPQMAQRIEDIGYEVPAARLELLVLGMTPGHCEHVIGPAVRALPGVRNITFNFSTDTVTVDHLETATPASEIKRAIRSLGYEVHDKGAGEDTADRERKLRAAEIRRQQINMLIAWPLGLIVMLFTFSAYEPLDGLMPDWANDKPLLFALTTPLVLGPGRQFFVHAWNGLVRGVTDMNLLYATGIGAAYGIAVINTFFPDAGFGGEEATFYEAAALLIAFIVLGRYLEALTRGRASEAIRKLMRLRPRLATVIRDGAEQQIAADEVVVGDVVLVHPGEAIPVDGVVTEGYSSVDESMISGESIPVEKQAGAEVVAGSINKTGAFRVEATRVGADTALAQIIRLVEDAQTTKAPIQALADRVAGNFILAVHALALAIFLFWFFAGYHWFFDESTRLILTPYELNDLEVFGFALLTSVTVLIISCPCAVGLATPAAMMAGTGKAAEYGILFKGADAVEAVSRIDTVVLDKTGTLTKGEPSVTETITGSGSDLTPEQVLTLAASAEKNSEHPLGEAIVRAATERGLEVQEPESFGSLPGLGVEARAGGTNVLLGNRALLAERGIDAGSLLADAERLEGEGKTVMFVTVDGQAAGLVAVADTLKETSAQAVRELRRMGLQVIMLTGDNQRTAKAIASELGIERVLAEVLPGEKSAEVQRLQAEGRRVAMVGDGVNDAPALAVADAGIAIGSGTDVARETGSVILVRDDVLDVASAVQVARQTMRLVRQNLLWAFGYNAAAIPLGAGLLYPFTHQIVSPELAALLMAMSSFSVTRITLRMHGYRPPVKKSGGGAAAPASGQPTLAEAAR
jgi:Cu+-exporting ATPase